MKVFVVYDSRYGNTKLVADNISEGLKQAGGFEVAVRYVKDINPLQLAGYEALVFGSSNHMGKASRTMRKFVDNLSSSPSMPGVLRFLTFIFRGNGTSRRQ